MTVSVVIGADPKRVLWVGGPPGKTFQKIVAKLAADNLAVVGQQEHGFDGLPTKIDAVLVSVDMLSHSAFDAAKAAAKVASIPCVSVRLDYSRSRAALVAAGLIAPDAPIPISTRLDADDILSKSDDPAAALRALIRSLPPELTRVAAEEATTSLAAVDAAARAALVASALEAFHLLAVCSDPSDAYEQFAAGMDHTERASLCARLPSGKSENAKRR